MSNALHFLRNDLDYAPFGCNWLRGLTPLRFTCVVVVCLVWGLAASRRSFFLEPIAEALRLWGTTSLSMLTGFLPMILLVVAAEARTRASATRRRVLALCAAVLLGALAYVAIVTILRIAFRGPIDMAYYWEYALSRFSRTLVFGSLAAATLFYAARERDARRRLHESRKSVVEIDRQSIELRLQLLRAQIEPHFLFNSLASVKRLYEIEPREGGRLLRSLREYLEAATRNRAPDALLGEEVALARTYLRLFQVRMGERLKVNVEIEPGLQAALVPSFMLGTLVENAVKHGLAPKGAGGTVSLKARRREDMVEIGVSDDGVGFREHTGAGVGLANTRARLKSLFGAIGRVDIRANEGGGVTATLQVPHRLAPAGAE